MNAPVKSGIQDKASDSGAPGISIDQRDHAEANTVRSAIRPEDGGSTVEEESPKPKDGPNAPPDPQGGSM